MKRLLLVAPTHMNLYNDILDELIKQGYQVEFIAIKSFPNDPFFLCRKYTWMHSKKKFLNRIEKYWKKVYESGKYTFEYDYLLVINGTAIHPCLFELLRKKNPNIRCINYLFDSTQNVYEFNRNFKYYDKVFTFDRSDAEKYKLKLLPIYWSDNGDNITTELDLFGFGAFAHNRFELFSSIRELADSANLTYFIKLYTPKKSNIKLFKFVGLVKYFLGLKRDMSFEEYSSDLISHETLSPGDFRKLICSSKITIDTCNVLQDGLTARCMWAVGAGKKIITTNANIMKYPFYSPKQILVVKNGSFVRSLCENFIISDFTPDDNYYKTVNQWRIDNWIKTLLD